MPAESALYLHTILCLCLSLLLFVGNMKMEEEEKESRIKSALILSTLFYQLRHTAIISNMHHRYFIDVLGCSVC